jgi:ABC-type branched-subunit amino acid transport system ATPase component
MRSTTAKGVQGGPAALLDVQGVTVRFQGLVANDAVALQVEEGTIAALIGPNGAGKTTLFNVVSGSIRPAGGRINFAGDDISSLDVVSRARLGMARTFQDLQLVGQLTALENVAIGASRLRSSILSRARRRRGALSSAQVETVASRALAFVGLADRADVAIRALPFGDRRRVELARALASGPRLLLLDEPASGLPLDETLELIKIIERARRDLGATVLVVEHDMSFVRQIAETTTVLDYGSVLATGPTASVLADPQVIAAYLGSPAVVEDTTSNLGPERNLNMKRRRSTPIRARSHDASPNGGNRKVVDPR